MSQAMSNSLSDEAKRKRLRRGLLPEAKRKVARSDAIQRMRFRRALLSEAKCDVARSDAA